MKTLSNQVALVNTLKTRIANFLLEIDLRDQSLRTLDKEKIEALAESKKDIVVSYMYVLYKKLYDILGGIRPDKDIQV